MRCGGPRAVERAKPHFLGDDRLVCLDRGDAAAQVNQTASADGGGQRLRMISSHAELLGPSELVFQTELLGPFAAGGRRRPRCRGACRPDRHGGAERQRRGCGCWVRDRHASPAMTRAPPSPTWMTRQGGACGAGRGRRRRDRGRSAPGALGDARRRCPRRVGSSSLNTSLRSRSGGPAVEGGQQIEVGQLEGQDGLFAAALATDNVARVVDLG